MQETRSYGSFMLMLKGISFARSNKLLCSEPSLEEHPSAWQLSQLRPEYRTFCITSVCSEFGTTPRLIRVALPARLA